MNKVLVAGVAGQVGCRAVRQLLDKDYEVKGSHIARRPNEGAAWGAGC